MHIACDIYFNIIYKNFYTCKEGDIIDFAAGNYIYR